MTIDPTGEERPRLSDDDLVRVMDLMSGSDSVELKVTIPAGDHLATIRGLPLDPVEAQPRQVFFFDTPELALNEAGVVVRARRIQGGRADTVIKLRPVEPSDLPAELRQSPAMKVEVDLIPGGFVCSASFKGRSNGEDVREAVNGKVPLRRIFSKDQREFYENHAPAGIGLDALVPLGPTFVLKATFRLDPTPSAPDGRSAVAEMWLYPDGSRILELSTKCEPREAFQVVAETRHDLLRRGISLTGTQQTKTKAALEFYRAELAAGGAQG
jgi:hypothetical protein